jgi:hypothetical protein
MLPQTFKVTNAREAKVINNFKNVKEKLLKTNAAVWWPVKDGWF